jgi:agmatine deiminase
VIPRVFVFDQTFYRREIMPNSRCLSDEFTKSQKMDTRRHFLRTTLSASALGLTKCGASASEISSLKLLTDSTPLADGYYMPGEETPHEATIMVFPPVQNWKGYGLRAARKEWATVANTIAEYETVRMVIHPDDIKEAGKMLSSEIEQIELTCNDGWARDTAPIFLKNATGERRAAGMTFNGWGGKFPPYSDDAKIKTELCARWKIPFYPIELVGEGGGVLVDGDGTLIVTEECLLHRNRNPQIDRATVEKRLLDGYGAKKCIWLGRGLTPDPVTDGHVDGMAAFVSPGVVLLHSIADKNDPNFAILADAKRRLNDSTDAQGRKFTIIDLPLASEVSQINFYLCNGAVIVPTANTEEDDEPLEIIKNTFPKREIIPVPGKILGEGGGGVHCITQQIPL